MLRITEIFHSVQGESSFAGLPCVFVRFTGCDLTGAQFTGAQMAGARLTRCELTGIGGVTSMRGSVVTSADAVALAFILASALGITIDDE